MKTFLMLAIMLAAVAARSQTTYPNIDDSTLIDNGTTGWGSCVTCAGGGSEATIATSPFQTRPSVDGDSRDFYINGAAYTNGLWWYKVGPNNAVANYTFDFWLNVSSGTQYAQTLEFDTFQFISGQEYMFGTQCNYASGTWDLWDAGATHWVHSSVACEPFRYNTWYRVTLNFHRTVDNYEHYDSLYIARYNSSGRIVAQHTYRFDQALPSGQTPPGWGDNLGVQFQMDIGPSGAIMQEWVDQVSLTAW